MTLDLLRSIGTFKGELCCDVLLERSLQTALPEIAPPLAMEIRHATHADLDLICAAYAPYPHLFLGKLAPDGTVPLPVRQLYADRLDRGELCFIATAAGQLVHINWTCLTWGDGIPGRPLRLRPHEIYTTDGVTTERFRGKNVHAFVLRAMLVHAAALGRTWAYTLAGVQRRESLTGLERLGWHECGRVHYWLYANAEKVFILVKRGKVELLFR